MIVKGIIKTINYNDNSCTVRLPLFETVATSGEVILSAVFMSQPGMYNGYAENDVVFVDFENDSLDSPIVIGKLYLGATAETASAKKGGIAVSSLNVSSDATLPVDTKIAVDRVATVADVDGGIASYKSIADIIKALRNTGSSIERLDKQNDELKDEGIASIKVEYLSQPRENQAPLANDKAWQISSPEYKDGYAIWQKTTWLNYRGQILNTEIICLSELASSATYRIKCSTRVHYGKQQKDVLVVTAMAKFGSDFETKDTRKGISLIYKWGSDGEENTVNDGEFKIELADIQNETLFITAEYNNEEYDTETITYVPLNTPTLSLSSDSSFIEYDSYGLNKINKDAEVQSTASVKLNNEELDNVEFKWSLDGCSAKKNILDQATIIITDLDQDVDIAYATCNATYSDNLGQSKTLTKTFTIAKNKQGKSFYKIDIFNDSVTISTDENGTITDSMKKLLPTWSSHDISCYYGDDLLQIYEYVNVIHANIPSWQNDTNFRVVYTEQNVEIITNNAPTFAIKNLTENIGYISYVLYRGTNRVAVAKFEIAKQPQGVAATSYWIDYSARIHKGANQQDDITATAWKKYGNSSSVQNNDVSIRYGWRQEDGNFSEYSEPNAGQITVNKDSFKNADLIFELGTIDENGNFVISESDSEFEVITYSPLNTPVLDLSNDSSDLTYKPNGEKIGTDEVSCIATVFLNGEVLTEGVNYVWTHTDEDNVVEEIKDENNKVIGSKIIVSKLASNTVEFTCTATIDNPAIFKNKIELQKVFTVARQIQGENSINYWLKLSSGVHLGANQQKAITVTAMQKVGTNAAEDIDESATLFYTFNKNESWNQVPGRVVGEGENAKTYYDTFDSSKIDGFKFEDSDLLIKAMHGENEYETESITYSPLNTPTLDLDNDTDTILYPAKPEDDINGPIGAPVKSKATLYLNGDELDATYSWILEDCSTSVTEDITTVTNNQTVTVAALKEDTARAICTATVTAEGVFKGKTYEKAFTVSKTRKGDNAVTYSLVLNYSSISVNPNFGTKVPEKLVGTWYIHDGENIQPFKTKFEYKIDTEINFIEEATDDNGKFEISTENIDTEIVLRLKVNNTIVKNETVSVIKDGENTIDYWLAPSHSSIIRDNNTASWYPNDIYVDVIKQHGMSPAKTLDLSEESIAENFTLEVAVDDEIIDLSAEENKSILTITNEGQYKVSLNSAPTSKLSLTLYTIVDNIEHFAYCINIGVVRDGTSNYSLDIFNDFVSIHADENGDCYADYDWSLTEHSIKAYYGNIPLALESISATTPTDTDINKYHLKYTANNIVFAADYPKLSTDNKTAEIKLADNDGVNYTTVPNQINYELYKGTDKVASGKFELSKINDGIKATSYWITTTSPIHKGTNQQSPLELTAWSKHGDEETKINNELFIRYSWRSENGTFSVFENRDYANGGALRGKITINNFVDADLCIQTSYKEDFSIINDTEIITYAPAGTPILDLENDFATLSYHYNVDNKQIEKINSDETVSTTAKVYLDRNELTTNVIYSWSCSDAQASYDATDNSIIVSEIKDGRADFTCTATLSDKSLFKEDIELTKVFTVAKQVKGDPSISYWLKTSTPVHTGSKQSEDIVVTAMHKIGEGTEGIDENALLFYCWADRWTNEKDKTWTAVDSYTLTIPRSECKDLELYIKATHDGDLTEADIYKTENKDKIFDEETITYSPLNTPVLDLDNEIDDLSYSADGTTLLDENTKVVSTATLFLNGKALPDTKIDDSTTELVKYVWTIKSGDCEYVLSDNNKTITVSKFAENVNKSEIICTATYKGESYTKILTINKKLKGDNAIYYAIKPEHSTIVYNTEAKTWNPSTLKVNFYIYDGSTASLFDNCKVTYTIDNNESKTATCVDGTLELNSSNINSQVSISLYDAKNKTIVDTEVIKVIDAAEAPYTIDIFNERVTAITNTGKLNTEIDWWESMTTHKIKIFRGSTLLNLNDVAILDSFDDTSTKYYQLVWTKNNIKEIVEVTNSSSDNTLKTYYITGLTKNDEANPNDLGTITYDLYANKNLVATSAFEFKKITTGISIIGVDNYYYAGTESNSSDLPPTDNLGTSSSSWVPNIADADHSESKPYLWNIEVVQYSNGTSGEPTAPALLGYWSVDGKGIESITEYYQVNNLTTISTPAATDLTKANGWDTVPPTLTGGTPYLWNVEKITFTKGDPKVTVTEPVIIGTFSRSITSVKNYYYATTEEDKTLLPDVGDIWEEGDKEDDVKWRDSISAADFSATKKYLWNYEEIFYDRALDNGTNSKETTPEIISVWSKEVKEIHEYYLISKSNDSSNFATEANREKDWSTVAVSPNSTYPYLWNKEATYYTDAPTVPVYTAAVIIGTYGETFGVNIIPEVSSIKRDDNNGTPAFSPSQFNINFVEVSGTNTISCARSTRTYRMSIYPVLLGNKHRPEITILLNEKDGNNNLIYENGYTFKYTNITNYINYDQYLIELQLKTGDGDTDWVVVASENIPVIKEGINAINYWLNVPTPVHKGSKHGENIVVTAMKQTNGTESTDTDAILFYRYDTESDWNKAAANHRLNFHTSEIHDDQNIYILATHKTKYKDEYPANSINGVNEDFYDYEVIQYSPVNSPILILTNDSASLPYNADGTPIGINDYHSVTTTAELWLNGSRIPSGVRYEWTASNCGIMGPESNKNNQTITINSIGTSSHIGTATCNATYKNETYTKTFTVTKQFKGNKGDSIASQTTYYALIHPTVHTGYIITPENNDEDLIVKAYDSLDGGGTGAHVLYSEQSVEEKWTTTPPTHTQATINEGWKYWTTVRTENSIGNSWFSTPIINEAVSGAYKLIQGKTTTYYSENDPAGNPIHDTYGDGMADGDCWFGPSYIDQGAFKEYEDYIGYYLKNGNTYGLVTEDNLQETLDGRGIDLGVDHAYSKGQVLQRWKGDEKKWEDVSSEIVENKVTANYINAKDITAKKIEILNNANSNILFKADGLNGNNEVEIAGFKVSQLNDFAKGLYLPAINNGNDDRITADQNEQYGVGLGTSTGLEDPVFWAGYNGAKNIYNNDYSAKQPYEANGGWQENTNCYITTAGKLVAKNIEATGGNIAGFNITPNYFYNIVESSDDETRYGKNETSKKVKHPGVGFAPKEAQGSWAIWAGPQSGNGYHECTDESAAAGNYPYGQDAPFKVSHDGTVYAEKLVLSAEGNPINNSLADLISEYAEIGSLKSNYVVVTETDNEDNIFFKADGRKIDTTGKNGPTSDDDRVKIGGWDINTDTIYKKCQDTTSGICAATSEASSGLSYALQNGASHDYYEITGIGTCKDNDIIIPKWDNYIPIKTIGMSAFENCQYLRSIIIPKNIVRIDRSAFYNCSSLLNVEIRGTLSYIANSTFHNCSSLISINIPAGTEDIEQFAFYNCRSLTSITLPKSITQIQQYAFTNCNKLKDIYYEGTESDWNNINIWDKAIDLTNINLHYESELPQVDEDQIKYTSLVNINSDPQPRFFAGAGTGSIIPQSVNDAKFLVLDDGSLYANAVKLSGDVVATAGKIGNWGIDSNKLGTSGNDYKHTWSCSRDMQLGALGQMWWEYYLHHVWTRDEINLDSTGAIWFKTKNIYKTQSIKKNEYDSYAGGILIDGNKITPNEPPIPDINSSSFTPTKTEEFSNTYIDNYHIQSKNFYINNICADDGTTLLSIERVNIPTSEEFIDIKLTLTLKNNNSDHATGLVEFFKSGTSTYSDLFDNKTIEVRFAHRYNDSNAPGGYAAPYIDIKKLTIQKGKGVSIHNTKYNSSIFEEAFNTGKWLNYFQIIFNFYGKQYYLELQNTSWDEADTHSTVYSQVIAKKTTDNLFTVKPTITSAANSTDGINLGAKGKAFKAIFTQNLYNSDGNNLLSDQKEKNTINYDISKYDSIFDSLKPASYKYNSGTSDRTHLGFIAQDIKKSIEQANLSTKECSIVVLDGEGFDAKQNKILDEEKTTYYIRPDQLHALEVRQIQLLKKRVLEQETTIKLLEERIKDLEEKIK